MNVGFVGWRGMVGSVLMQRMRAENDFEGVEPVFFSTSQVGLNGPEVNGACSPLLDATDIDTLRQLDAVVSCQGGSYTESVYADLRAVGWRGFWIDAASTLRMADDSMIVLDPVNGAMIRDGIANGLRTFVGGNCTVSLMLMGIGGLFEADMVEWLSSMTYQSASGAGAKNMRELLSQMKEIGLSVEDAMADPANSILEIDRLAAETITSAGLPTECFGAPLAGSLIPWIDRLVEGGQTREEWKGHAETNKILGCDPGVTIDGICVRVGAMRCHSQGLTIKLRKDVPMDEIESAIAEHNAWSGVVPNEKSRTLADLSPAAVSGTLNVPVGRLHKLRMGSDYLGAFTVGDQLLWGAAEPVRRMLVIAREAFEG